MVTYRQNLTTLLGHGRPDGPRWSTDRPVDYVPGCAMLVRAEVFRGSGLLNGEYFAYHEDVEFCVQAAEHGFGTFLVGSSIAYHEGSGSTGGGYTARRKYMMGVNTVWFLREHGTPVRWARFFLYDVLPLPLVWLAGLPRGRGRAVLAKGIGMLHGALGRRVTADVLRPGAGPLW
jgi:GT2 family glycosyltransferase